MTLGGWLIYLLIAGVIAIPTYFALTEAESSKGKIAAALIAVLLAIIVLLIMLWWYGSTEAGKRAFKTQKSNFEGGIEREVRVYDVDGELIQSYAGKFDVVHDENRILFDDEDGKRHVIYYPTGTIIIDEK